ncbi:GntR family transcriptional regulator [Ilumatobacter nonamiensis]|uniref:GntR family transcriptional regulator n=1 Tax=Ilumatobacter nonamiensis TaxID=467093 RepID=UPI000349B7F3|nr:GntR family transcriptional regulator [Ilumatobacter nonamiensis]
MSTPNSLAERAYDEIRRMIIRLELAPGDVVREADLSAQLDMSRTPIREALQRLARDHFVTVIPRRGMFVSAIDVHELSMLYETRAIMEPYAARLATRRGTADDWAEMADLLEETRRPGTPAVQLIELDRRCHEIIWRAAGNRFLTSTLDALYAQSDRLWHMYLADVADMADAVDEHAAIHDALERGDEDLVADLVEMHVNSFDAQVRDVVAARLDAPLTRSR